MAQPGAYGCSFEKLPYAVRSNPMHASLRWRAFPAFAWAELSLSYHEFYLHPPTLSADSMRRG
jgi:hypothetical protein